MDDVPVAVWAETDGPGDDIRIELRNNEVAEVQVKKGLQKSANLWKSLLSLAAGIQNGEIHYGALVVSPDSSRTVWYSLSQDVIHLGDGRSDALSDVGKEWLAMLEAAGLPVGAVCKRLRICVVHGLHVDGASIRIAIQKLSGLCEDEANAWSRLYQEAHAVTARRGRWDASSLARMLTAHGVRTKPSAVPGSIVSELSRWVFDANQSFSIFGVRTALSISDVWLPLKARVIGAVVERADDVASAMARYHASANGSNNSNRDAKMVDAEWIGRFRLHAVVEAGPGMGKSTLMTRLAYLYSRDGYPVLKARLSAVAARMTAGFGFWESVLHFGLDGSGLSVEVAANSGLQDWVLLCDGLDECGGQQEPVAAGILLFTKGYPRARVIVTTRRIGYHTAKLSELRHYEILAPEASAGPANLAKLLRAVMSTELDTTTDRVEALAIEQLKRSPARDVVSRSPQLLGMAASLLARGGELGSSKAQLYQNLFGIIDAAPNPRSVTLNPPSLPVLTRVLSILGWQLISDPHGTINEISRLCADRLRLDMGVPPLRAQETVAEALQHWQDVGLIEQVHYGPTVMLTFIHKTFAEFAAARFLWGAMEAEERRVLLSSCLESHDVWSEVLSFASNELGEEILQELLKRQALDDRNAASRALRVLAETPEGVSKPTRTEVISLAFDAVDAPKSIAAYSSGLLLVRLAPRFPNEIGAFATERLHSPQRWTRLIAWACTVEAGHDYDLAAAHATLLEFLEQIGPARGSLFGGLRLGIGADNDLLEQMALAVLRRAVVEWSSEQIERLLQSIVGFGTVRFHENLVAIASAHKVSVPGARERTSKLRFLPMEGYREAHDAALRALLNGLRSTADAVSIDAPAGPPLQLSAFLDVAGFNESPASDVWAWTEPYAHAVVREVLHGLVQISMVDVRQLQLEITAMLARLDARAANAHGWLFLETVDVDVPEPDWSKVPCLGLDKSKLELATLHESQWLAATATNLLESLNQLTAADVVNLLGKARGYGFATASYLTRSLGELRTDLLLDRMNGPVVPGFEYLISEVDRIGAQWSDRLAAGIGSTLLEGDARSATEAAALAFKHVQLGAAVSPEMLESAYQFWVVNEEPYPKKSGLIPDSPRKTLLSAMNLVGLVSCERAIELLSDYRNDVKELAFGLVAERAGSSDAARALVVAAMATKKIIASSVHRILGTAIAFADEDVSRICQLLADEDPAYRLAAMAMLRSHRLTHAQVAEMAKRLVDDPHREVSDTARAILEKL